MTPPSLRDAIAAEMHKSCEQQWNSKTRIFIRHGIDVHYPDADAVLKVVAAYLRSDEATDIANGVRVWWMDQPLNRLADALTKETDNG